MALTHPDGTRVVVLKGNCRNKTGVVRIKGRLRIVVLDNGDELMGVSDEMVRKL
jgi:hypothetical protein